MGTRNNNTPALVVGLSIHGLAVARALAKAGVPVYCLSDRLTPQLPTTYTRYARVRAVKELNTEPLSVLLMAMADEIGGEGKIVLFPTSDRIVRGIAAVSDAIRTRYLLSWMHCRELVLELQRKDSLPAYCDRLGIRYPTTRALINVDDCRSVADSLRFPLVVKPVQPLSSFKAIRVTSALELEQTARRFVGDLPFVVQEWIEGPEPSLYACTAYVDRGRPLFMVTSRKLAASPPGLGQGTVFETVEKAEIRDLSERFLGQFDLTGPVAVEFKQDHRGEFWLIEPNVGRTEYCVDLVIQSGFNLPYIEYLHVTGQSAEIVLPSHLKDCVWFDTDKDPACFIKNLAALRLGRRERRSPIFPYFAQGDLRPFVVSVVQQCDELARAGGRRIGRILWRSIESKT